MILFNLHSHHRPTSSDEYVIRNAWVHLPVTSSYRLSCGIHPWYAGEITEVTWKRLKQCLNDNRVVALGECGLDRLRGPALEIQQFVFHTQVELAEYHCKPMILHEVRCVEEIVQLRKSMKPTMPWIIHGFRGNLKAAEQLVQSGCLLSFGEALRYDELNRQVFCQSPSTSLFLETDMSRVGIREIFACAEALRPGITSQILRNATRIFPNVLPGI